MAEKTLFYAEPIFPKAMLFARKTLTRLSVSDLREGLWFSALSGRKHTTAIVTEKVGDDVRTPEFRFVPAKTALHEVEHVVLGEIRLFAKILGPVLELHLGMPE